MKSSFLLVYKKVTQFVECFSICNVKPMLFKLDVKITSGGDLEPPYREVEVKQVCAVS